MARRPVVILVVGVAPVCASAPRDPQAADRDRGAPDRGARDRAVRRPGLPPLPAGHGLPRRADRELRGCACLARGVEVRCVDTGLDTPTGGRIKRLEGLLAGEETFCATYADGLADIDLARLLRFHEDHGALATITVVRPELQFGVAELDGVDGRVLGFREKPRSEHWINGGFLCRAPPRCATSTTTGCSSAQPVNGSPPTVSCAPTATRASGSAWTPTRTPSRSTTCGPQAPRPGQASDRPRRITSHDRPRDRPRPRQRRLRCRRPPRPSPGGARRRRDRHARGGSPWSRAWRTCTGGCWSRSTSTAPPRWPWSRPYFGQNVQTAFAVGHARGVTMLAAGERAVPCFSYTPQRS